MFFAMPNFDVTMKNIVLNYHLFETDTIIKEYKSHLLSLILFLKLIIVKTKSQFRIYFVNMAHTKLLVEPYPIWLFNLLCRLIFVKLPINTSLNMRTLITLPVKSISS